MTLSVPALEPTSPPDTGASRLRPPVAMIFSATSWLQTVKSSSCRSLLCSERCLQRLSLRRTKKLQHEPYLEPALVKASLQLGMADFTRHAIQQPHLGQILDGQRLHLRRFYFFGLYISSSICLCLGGFLLLIGIDLLID